jgi:hypothetical protein
MRAQRKRGWQFSRELKVEKCTALRGVNQTCVGADRAVVVASRRNAEMEG